MHCRDESIVYDSFLKFVHGISTLNERRFGCAEGRVLSDVSFLVSAHC